MTKKKARDTRDAAMKRIARIQEQIRQLDYVSSGTLVSRTKLCGKPSCRCAHDRAARHGPYYEWGFMKDGRQVHRMVTSEQAAILRKALANYRAVLRLLRQWERQTVRVLNAVKPKS